MQYLQSDIVLPICLSVRPMRIASQRMDISSDIFNHLAGVSLQFFEHIFQEESLQRGR